MAAPIALRTDYGASDLRGLAKQSKNAGQTRRLLALAVIYDGGSREDAAGVGCVGRQTVRDWVLLFNAEGPAGLLTAKRPGRPQRLKAEHRAALARWIEEGPNPAVDGVVRWRLVDLAQRLYEEFKVAISDTRLSQVVRDMGYRKLSARPRHHAQAPDAIEAFKKSGSIRISYARMFERQEFGGGGEDGARCWALGQDGEMEPAQVAAEVLGGDAAMAAQEGLEAFVTAVDGLDVEIAADPL